MSHCDRHCADWSQATNLRSVRQRLTRLAEPLCCGAERDVHQGGRHGGAAAATGRQGRRHPGRRAEAPPGVPLQAGHGVHHRRCAPQALRPAGTLNRRTWYILQFKPVDSFRNADDRIIPQRSTCRRVLIAGGHTCRDGGGWLRLADAELPAGQAGREGRRHGGGHRPGRRQRADGVRHGARRGQEGARRLRAEPRRRRQVLQRLRPQVSRSLLVCTRSLMSLTYHQTPTAIVR